MKNLDYPPVIQNGDKSGMLKGLSQFSNQVEGASEIGKSFTPPDSFRNVQCILFTGVGGSGLPGEILKSYLSSELSVPVVVNKNYSIPNFVGEDTLAFVVSYSGDTEETIEAFKKLKERRAKIIVTTSGGELGRIAKEEGIPSIFVPQEIQPRMAIGYLFFPILITLEKLGMISSKESDIREVIDVLREMKHELEPSVPLSANQAKQLAKRLYQKIPIVYGVADSTDVVAARWKAEFNENSKVSSFFNVFPELNHNEIVGFDVLKELLQNFEVILLRDREEQGRIRKRIEITKSLISPFVSGISEVWSRGKAQLARLFSLIYIGDYTSIYLAILNGVDPIKIDKITHLKKRLKESEA